MEPILIKGIKKFEDTRGVFYESYKKSFLKENFGIEEDFVQDNHSVSCKGTIRGMHYQWDKPMGKLVRVPVGSITDIIVDIRNESQTVGQVYTFELNDKNLNQLYVPPGFAHGFVCRSDTAIVMYKCTSEYNKDGESGINPFDKKLDIDWGIDYKEAVVSEKDIFSKNFEEYLKEPKF